jgi:hypothetical protein
MTPRVRYYLGPRGWANASHRALALRAEPCFTVSALRASIDFRKEEGQ